MQVPLNPILTQIFLTDSSASPPRLPRMDLVSSKPDGDRVPVPLVGRGARVRCRLRAGDR